ncbi:unnamed protein product [Boreogadus saida]
MPQGHNETDRKIFLTTHWCCIDLGLLQQYRRPTSSVSGRLVNRTVGQLLHMQAVPVLIILLPAPDGSTHAENMTISGK